MANSFKASASRSRKWLWLAGGFLVGGVGALLLVVLVLGIIAAFAIPQALTAVKAYRLHSDASAVPSCRPY